MTQERDIFKAIHSQRAIRKLKADSIPNEIVNTLLEAAIRAPSGANQQTWKFLIIRDSKVKTSIGSYYSKAWELAYGDSATVTLNIDSKVKSSAAYLADHLDQAPVLILACVEHDGSKLTLTRGSSIYPAVQNILLAARALGIGSVLTTLHRRYEKEIKHLLGIPENVDIAAILPIGYPTGEESYGPSKRKPVIEVSYNEKWGITRTD